MIKSVAFATLESELIVTPCRLHYVCGPEHYNSAVQPINQIKYIPPQFVLAASIGLEV